MKSMLMSFFVLFCIVLTGLAYTYWQIDDNSEYSSIIELGQTSKVETLSVPDGKHLVPEGIIMGENDVNAVYYTYLVEVEDSNPLNVSVNDVFFIKNNVRNHDDSGLLCFDFEFNQINETQVHITLTIRLNMPETEAQYNLIKGSTVSFNLAFEH